jgi:hypothetical protein
MPDVIVNVTPQPTASVEVNVDNVASYYYDLAKQWAISPDLVEQLDYSSKYYANKSKEAADSILTDAGFIAVSQDLTNIDTVANSITNVNAVANDVTNINLVADDLTNIDSVAGSISNVNSVASDLTNIDSVAGDLTNIDIVASAKTNIDTNATYISNINTVAGSISNVNTVAGDLTNINAVANDLTNIGTVASNITDVNTCATNISNINICAANIPVITDKVSKTGDTMTGDLIINKETPVFSGRSPELDETSTTTPSSNIWGGILNTTDKNGNFVSHFYTVHNVYNNFAIGATVYRDINGITKQAYFDINIAGDGGDFAGASTGVKQSITNWAFPSSRWDDLTLGASGTRYTAPADGYVWIGGTQAGGSGYVFLKNVNNGLEFVSQPSNVSSFEIRAFIPVSKGQLYEVNYGDVFIYWFRFIYANGEA